MPFSPVPELLDEIRAGRMIVLVDDEDRENEGDIVFAAQLVTPEKINFMIKEARGELCLALEEEACDRLGLELQGLGSKSAHTNRHSSAFTMTIEAASGVTTGISASDRSRTIAVASDPSSTADDIVSPGHVHPLRARAGGCLVRPGHTEGSVDLCRMSGLRSSAAVIMEILKDDGTVARLPDLTEFAKKHGLKLGCIADLIAYRRRTERLVERSSSVRLPTRYGEFDVHLYTSPHDHNGHLALTMGITTPNERVGAAPIEEPILTRVHSQCLTGDVFGSLRCDCGEQLDAAFRQIAAEGRGVILYMRQEGRGIGLLNKLKAYALQDAGLDTVEANVALGFKADHRNYGTGASILFDLGVRSLRLLTNNPTKRSGLAGYGLEITETVPLIVEPNPSNERYLQTKKAKLGHLL